uniref:Golgi membrane protein 1 n=1 Tax=Xiphophorus couchianus TaxID=32473 RepID=A0A3B5KW47_9TELE
MGGLGNGRRGGRAPSLMIASLITCILVLGFKYWVSSSRNLELQTKLYELEGQVRRGAAERGVAEMKKNEFQEQIQKQVQEINHMESLRRKQLEDVSQEKQNISSSTKTIEELKGSQLNQMNNDLGKLQKELQRCQASPNILNNKLTVDIAHCQSQVLSQKKLCDEKMAAVKLEVQKNVQKAVPPEGAPTQVTCLTVCTGMPVLIEADPGVQDILNGQEKAEETANGQRPEEPDEYDADEQIVDGVDLEKQRNKNTEEEMADYNGDDENEGEYEADKQAALAQN